MARRCLLLAALAAAAVACGPGDPAGTFTLPAGEASRYDTAYIARVVATPGEDGTSEHVVLRNNWDHPADIGGWSVRDDDGNRLPIPPSTFVQPDGELRVYTGAGESTDTEIHSGVGGDVLDDVGDTVTLHDSSGAEVARFTYGG